MKYINHLNKTSVFDNNTKNSVLKDKLLKQSKSTITFGQSKLGTTENSPDDANNASPPIDHPSFLNDDQQDATNV